MAYGTVKVDTVTFTYNSGDTSTTFSGLHASTTNNLTLSGTASANTFTGTTANFTNTNAQNISVTTLLSGLAITGETAGFTTVTGTTVTGTTANFVTVSGTSITGGTAGFTTVTGTTVTGTTANFVTLSGTTVTGNIGQFTSLTGATTTMTSGVFALGTEPLPSISFVSDTNTGIYSPGADQLAISTNGTGRLFVNSAGQVGIGTNGAQNKPLHIYSGANDSEIRLQTNSGTEQNAYLTLRNSGGNLDLYSVNGDIVLNPGNSPAAYFKTDGKLGLGTSAPEIQNWRAGTYFTLANTTTRGQLEIDSAVSDSSSASLGALIYSYSTNTTNHKHVAVIEAGTEGATANQRGGKLVFYTKANGTTSPTAAVTIDSSQRVGIGSTAPNYELQINASDAVSVIQLTNTSTGATASDGLLIYNNGVNAFISNEESGFLKFQTAGAERAQIDAAGRLLVGTSSTLAGATDSLLQIRGNSSGTQFAGKVALATDVAAGSIVSGTDLGAIYFGNVANGIGGLIECKGDAQWGTNDYPGRLVFSTTADGAASPTEAVRINSSQQLLVGTTASLASFDDGRLEVSSKASQLAIVADATASSAIGIGIRGNTSTTAVSFFNASDGATCGTIVLNSGSTSYNTSSDYRLKENVAEVTDGITRLQQLKPSRFNFIADPNKTVDGFIAHEVQDIVPEAITGDKDAVDDEGNPVYQGIDQSKLVPLLTAALQEALQKIEDLEGRLTAAGL